MTGDNQTLQALAVREEEIQAARTHGMYVAAPLTVQFTPDVDEPIVLIGSYEELQEFKRENARRKFNYFNPIGQ